MGFFAQYFRLRSRSPLDTYIVFDGAGPEGPPGPAGAAGAAGAAGQDMPDYQSFPVDQGIVYSPTGNGISRVAFITFGGPNNSEIAIPHGISGLSNVSVLSIRGVVQPVFGSGLFPVPSSNGPHLGQLPHAISLRVDDNFIYVASTGNLTFQAILVIIDFLT